MQTFRTVALTGKVVVVVLAWTMAGVSPQPTAAAAAMAPINFFCMLNAPHLLILHNPGRLVTTYRRVSLEVNDIIDQKLRHSVA